MTVSRGVSAAILLCLLAPAARAEDPVFAGAVARSADLDGVAAKVNDGLSEALELSAVASLTRKGTDGAPDTVSAEELDRLLSDARGRYLEGDFKGAATQTREAVSRFEESAAFEEAPKLWSLYTELLLVQSLAFGRLNNTRASDRALVKIIAVRPDYVPDPGLTPPKAASRYQKLREGLLAKQAKLDLVAVPAGARAIVDGREVGLTPVNVSLPHGTHFITVRSGSSAASERIRLREDTTLRLTAGDPRAARADTLLSALKGSVAEQDLGARALEIAPIVYAAMVDRVDGQITVFLGRFQKGRLDTVSALAYRDDLSDIDDASVLLAQTAVQAVTDGWAAGEGDAGQVRGRFLGRTDTGNGGGEEPGGTPWLWVGVGSAAVVVAAAAVVGGVLLFSPAPNPGGLDVIVDTSGL